MVCFAHSGQITTEDSDKHPLLTHRQHRGPPGVKRQPPLDCRLRTALSRHRGSQVLSSLVLRTVCLSVCVAGSRHLRQRQSFWSSHASRGTDSLSWPRQQLLRVPWSRSWGGGLWAETHHWQGLPHHCRGTVKLVGAEAAFAPLNVLCTYRHSCLQGWRTLSREFGVGEQVHVSR